MAAIGWKEPMSGTGDEILFFLKTHGRATAAALAERLRISPQGVRQQLEKLQGGGLVAFADEAMGKGRPRRFWALTDSGHGRFPDTHAQLTADLIEAVRAELGEDALDRLVARREHDTLEAYRRRLARHETLRAKVAALAELRTAEGYMADWQKLADGFLLVENHCPICAAARACQGFCRSELAIFQAVLGTGCTVDRIDHLLAGARRCAYRIIPVDRAATRTRRAAQPAPA
jgi:predicted ArsR family transcriptional regulator